MFELTLILTLTLTPTVRVRVRGRVSSNINYIIPSTCSLNKAFERE